jgi:hypothetical protein
LKENIRITKAKHEEIKKQNELDAVELKELTAINTEKQTVVDKLVEVTDFAKKAEAANELKCNSFGKANAALEAKLKFIEDKYDYSSTAKGLTLNDFKDIM